MSDLTVVDGNKVMADSRDVAKRFGKAHKNVLRAFDRLECSANFNRLNYAPVEYIDAKGELRRTVKMTKDGFTMLAMGFTGTEATKWKEEYIAEFNAMADHIAHGQKDLWQQMQALIAKEVGSQVRASFGSHLMLTRKREIPHLRDERGILESAIQPSLLN